MVDEVARFVNDAASRVAASVQSGDTHLISLLTLLNIAEEYMALQRQVDSEREQDRTVLGELMARIDNALE